MEKVCQAISENTTLSLDKDLHPTMQNTKLKCSPRHGWKLLILNVVVSKVIFDLLGYENHMLLVERDASLVLNFHLDVDSI